MKKETQVKYSSFIFLKADKAFKRLAPNERIGLKQKLETFVAQKQDDLFLRIYTLNGFNADCDMLLWLISSDLEKIHRTWTMFSTCGAGQYLDAFKIYTSQIDFGEDGTDEETIALSNKLIGLNKFVNIEPVTLKRSWHKLSQAEQTAILKNREKLLKQQGLVSEKLLTASALTKNDYIIFREAATMEILAKAHIRLKQDDFYDYVQKDQAFYFCLGQDLSCVLDSLA